MQPAAGLVRRWVNGWSACAGSGAKEVAQPRHIRRGARWVRHHQHNSRIGLVRRVHGQRNRPNEWLVAGKLRYDACLRADTLVEAPLVAALAQLVEHIIRNDGATGSSPVSGTIPHIPVTCAADARMRSSARFARSAMSIGSRRTNARRRPSYRRFPRALDNVKKWCPEEELNWASKRRKSDAINNEIPLKPS